MIEVWAPTAARVEIDAVADGSALREHSDTEPGPSPLLQGPTLLARKEPTDA